MNTIYKLHSYNTPAAGIQSLRWVSWQHCPRTF